MGNLLPIDGPDYLQNIQDNFNALESGPATHIYLDTVNGNDTAHNGRSWVQAFKTAAKAAATVETLGVIHVIGDIREQIVGSNLKFDITWIGHGSLHHADLPSAAYHPGANIWRGPASPTAVTPLLELRARGWKFLNFMFAGLSDAACIKFVRNALEGVSEFDPSHSQFINCRFVDGKYAIEDAGGSYNHLIAGCEFKGFATGAIVGTSTSVANPLNWKIKNNIFAPDNGSDFGNALHLDLALNSGIIERNVFGKVRSTGKYIDLTGGNNNIVGHNTLAGVYNTDDYVAGTDDSWLQNAVAVVAVTAPDGLTLAAPAAP